MPHQSLKHGTISLERTFEASPEEVFAAWESDEARRFWGSPSDTIELRHDAADFSVGGQDISACVSEGRDLFRVLTRYLDIVRDRRIVFTEVIESDGKPLGACLVSAEILAEPGGTRLIVTVQTAAFDDSALQDGVEEGWSSALDRLVALLTKKV